MLLPPITFSMLLDDTPLMPERFAMLSLRYRCAMAIAIATMPPLY